MGATSPVIHVFPIFPYFNTRCTFKATVNNGHGVLNSCVLAFEPSIVNVHPRTSLEQLSTLPKILKMYYTFYSDLCEPYRHILPVPVFLTRLW